MQLPGVRKIVGLRWRIRSLFTLVILATGWRKSMTSSFFMNFYRLYRDGFQQMTLGRTLWKIIFIKLLVMFVVLKLFFFPNILQTQFSTDQQRADHVLMQLTGSAGNK
jgi:hypothetical protein